MTNLFIFGLGYSATEIARHAQSQGWVVSGTLRDAGKTAAFENSEIDTTRFDGGRFSQSLADRLSAADRLLVSVPPGKAGDPVVGGFERYLQNGGHRPQRITYLSSLSVYGDFGGAWIDEEAVTEPVSKRGKLRLDAEAAWRNLGLSYQIPVDILRLAGIYGPGRNLLLRLISGNAKRITGTGHVFNRIHVDDIARITLALMQRTGEGGIFNVCDSAPAAQETVILYAANLLGMVPPQAIQLDEAGLSPLGRSFYEENKKVSNDRVLTAAGIKLRHPTYREGLTAIASAKLLDG